MNKIALQQSVIENAFDFLEKAISQFEAEPKYSVINFCAAVELILKARLMEEHWSLIVDTKAEPNLKKFKTGDFKSIGLKQLIPKLMAVTDEKIPNDAIHSFNKLAEHRNRTIHFFHEAHHKKDRKQLLEEIAIEQCHAWFFLQRLLTKWNEIFGHQSYKIEIINHRMKAHNKYLDVVFERIKTEIESDKQRGAYFSKCSLCKKNASEIHYLTKHCIEFKCRVCMYSQYAIAVNCKNSNCETTYTISEGADKATCPTCDTNMDIESLLDAIDTGLKGKDSLTRTTINCACCYSGYAIEHEHLYICNKCLHITDNVYYCEYCNDGQIGESISDDSYLVGCEFCDGYAGNH